MKKNNPTVKLYTLGCKVNQYETQRIREGFGSSGFKEAKKNQRADIYIINTCTVTHRADSDSLKSIRRARKENPSAKVIVTGCLSELDDEKIRDLDGVEIIVKNKDKEKISSYLKNFGGRRFPKTTPTRGITSFSGHTRAFLKIQDGCNNCCSYCRVPLARGASVSRLRREIIREAGELVKGGFKEIVLTGICLGAYGRDLAPKDDLVSLIKELEEIPGLRRIRLSSIEAADITDNLIKRISASAKLCRHLHIPLQSGDDQILKKMNRSYTGDDYLRLIKKIKRMAPGISITTDCLVGFPGESKENFLNTLSLIRKISPLRTHIFTYSPREGTAAFSMQQMLKPEEIRERFHRLNQLSGLCARKNRRRFLGKKMSVLVERRSNDNPKLWEGYSDNYIRVRFPDKRNLKNQIIKVCLDKQSSSSIIGLSR